MKEKREQKTVERAWEEWWKENIGNDVPSGYHMQKMCDKHESIIIENELMKICKTAFLAGAKSREGAK